MNEKICIREYRKTDDSALADVIREAWQYDRFCSPRTAAGLAKVYLTSCLINQTFIRVAEVDGQPAGVIMGKDIARHQCPLSLRLKWLRSIVELSLSKEARTVSRVFTRVQEIDDELLAASGKNYQGELAFFAVGADCRGKGIGKLLFEAVVEEMRSCGIPEFFLFTDTSCNYPFYEHMGLTRRCEKHWTMEMGGRREEMTFFLYDYRY